MTHTADSPAAANPTGRAAVIPRTPLPGRPVHANQPQPSKVRGVTRARQKKEDA
jgi:hypothetical protein